jgi:hypothetical protein
MPQRFGAGKMKSGNCGPASATDGFFGAHPRDDEQRKQGRTRQRTSS